MSKYRFRHEYFTGYAQTDPGGVVRPSCVLALMQEAAGTHSVILGNDRDTLMAGYNAFWMLVRVQVSFTRPVYGNENLTVETWARKVKGAMVYRDFALYVGDEKVGDAQSIWVVASFETRKLMRPAAAGVTDDFLDTSRPDGVEILPIRFPETMTYAFDKTVRTSDLDVNYHLNNTKYADILLDTIDVGAFADSYPADFQINYVQECRAGTTICVETGSDGDRHFVRGKKDGSVCFEAVYTMAKR